VVSRTRPPAIAETLAARLGGALVARGSAGAKAMAADLGARDADAHRRAVRVDSAAPVGCGRPTPRVAPRRCTPAVQPPGAVPPRPPHLPSRAATRCSR
jgi:hypothetical protein